MKEPERIAKLLMEHAKSYVDDLDQEGIKIMAFICMDRILNKCVACLSMKRIDQCGDTDCALYRSYHSFAPLIEMAL